MTNLNPSRKTLDKIWIKLMQKTHFNAKSNNCCKNDTSFHEGSMTDAVTSNYGLHQQVS